MSQSFALALRRFAVLLLCTLPLISQAASSKEAPLDLSILKQGYSLRPYMTAQQRITYVEASGLIKQGQSDVRSGQNLQSQKPSKLDPSKDLKPIHDRGRRLEAQGHANIADGQKQLVELLTAVKAAQTAHQAQAAKKYNFAITEQDDYATALELAATQTLEACQDAGYKHVFFDGLRIVTSEANSKAGPKIHNAAYDTFIEADGTLFSVAVPLGLKLANSEASPEYTFQYDNASVFEGEKVALLAVELIAPSSTPEALLSVRTIDLASQQLITSVMFYIADASAALNPEDETPATETTELASAETDSASTKPADNETTAPVEIKAARTVPASVTIDNSKQLIEKLAGLPTPYFFETVTSAENPAQSALVNALLKDTILKNSDLRLVDSHFIQHAYLPADAPIEAFANAATAELTLTANENDYSIVARAYESGRELEVGSITLQLPE